MRALLFLSALILAGCACHRVKVDPPVRVSRCHAIVDGVMCGEAADRYATFCACTGDV